METQTIEKVGEEKGSEQVVVKDEKLERFNALAKERFGVDISKKEDKKPDENGDTKSDEKTADIKAGQDSHLDEKDDGGLSEKTQKRIATLTGKRKEAEEKAAALLQEKELLEKKLSEYDNRFKELETKIQPKEPVVEDMTAEERAEYVLEKKRSKYADEDSTKAYHLRREMSVSDMESFNLEDPIRFNEWIARRALRHDREFEETLKSIAPKQEVVNTVQDDSGKRAMIYKDVVTKNPEYDLFKVAAELKAKGLDETAIEDTLRKDTTVRGELFRFIESTNGKYANRADGFAIMVDEFQKTRAKNKEKELESQIEVMRKELERLKSAPNGVSSSTAGIRSEDIHISDADKRMAAIAKKAGITLKPEEIARRSK
jgi:hypothetical protein